METYWKYILIGAIILILGIVGLVLGLAKTILKNKTTRDVAKWLGAALTGIGGIVIIIGFILYLRRNKKYQVYPGYPGMYGMNPQIPMYPPGYPQQGYSPDEMNYLRMIGMAPGMGQGMAPNVPMQGTYNQQLNYEQ